MTYTVYVTKVVERTNQTGVQYLIYDDVSDTYKKSGAVLRGGANPQSFGNTNAESLFNNGSDVPDARLLIQELQNQTNETVYQDAYLSMVQSLRGGGTLADMNTAAQTVYTNANLNIALITDFFNAYRTATDNQRYLFFVIFVVTVFGLIRQGKNDS